jgi:hypothetical protein
MYTLVAKDTSMDAVRKALSDTDLGDVQVHRPFLGKVVIQCGSESSVTMLRGKVEGLRAG